MRYLRLLLMLMALGLGLSSVAWGQGYGNDHDINGTELRNFDGFLDSHPSIQNDLRRDPGWPTIPDTWPSTRNSANFWRGIRVYAKKSVKIRDASCAPNGVGTEGKIAGKNGGIGTGTATGIAGREDGAMVTMIAMTVVGPIKTVIVIADVIGTNGLTGTETVIVKSSADRSREAGSPAFFSCKMSDFRQPGQSLAPARCLRFASTYSEYGG